MTNKQAKNLIATVKSDKMDKTRVVEIVKKRQHPKYKKSYLVTSRFTVHDEKNESKIGDIVEISQTRPMSKNKAWKIVGKILTNQGKQND